MTWFISFVLVLLNYGSVLGQEPLAIFTGRSVIEVRAGLRHIYQRLERKDLVAALDSAAVTNLVTGNLKGLGLDRPLGALVFPGRDGPGTILTFVPITNEESFREFLRRHGLTPKAAENGLASVQIPLLGTVHFRCQEGYAWFALAAESLNQSLPNIEKILPAAHRKHTLAATLYLERMSDEQRRQILQRGQRGLGWLLQTRGDSPASLAEAGGLAIGNVLLHRLAEDAQEITAIAHVDRGKDVLWAELDISPRENVPWRQEVQARNQPVTINVPVQAWAKFKRVDPVALQNAAKVFQKPEQDQLQLSMTGGESLRLRAELSGAALAYHAALEKAEKVNDKPVRKTREERRQERRKRNSNPPG